MDYISHSLGGVAIGVGAVYLANKAGIDANMLGLVAGGLLGGLLPDIDIPTSYLGNKIKPVANLIYGTVGHRTLTHSLTFMIVIGAIGSLFDVGFGVGVALGILSHIILDMIQPNTNGVSLYYPFYKKRINFFKSRKH